MEIRIATQEDREDWDFYVDKRPDVTPYCCFAWKEAVEDAYGHKACCLLAKEDGQVVGIFPLINFHIPFVSRRLVSLPYCDLGDIIADSPEISKLLINAALALAKKMKAASLEIRSCHENLFDINEDFSSQTPSSPIPMERVGEKVNLSGDNSAWHINVQTGKVRMLLDLPESSEELWRSFKSKLRSQVNKAEKNGLTFSWGDMDNLSAFYQVFSRNMHNLGSPAHSRKWIRNIVEHYGENARMGLVFYEDQPVGCGIILFTKHAVSIPWASTLREYNRLSPNMMLYWNFLKFAADNQKKYLILVVLRLMKELIGLKNSGAHLRSHFTGISIVRKKQKSLLSVREV